MRILQMSISAGILVIAVVIIRAISLNKLPKTMFLALWGVALVRLIVPVSIPSRFNFYSIIEGIFKRFAPDISTLGIENVLPIDVPVTGTAEVAGRITPMTQEQVFSIAPATIIWSIGVLAMFVFFMVVYIKNYKELRFALPIRNNKFLDKWLAEHRIIRPIAILQSDRITTPVATGMVKPRIILPKSMNMDDKQLLRYVLAHEYYHIRRFDILWKLLIVLTLCIHWFNPMVWVMFVLTNRDLELACDEMVIRHFGADTKIAYAYSLIGMAEQRSKFASLYNGFSKNAIEERINSIMKIKKISLMGISFALLLVIGTVTVFATNAKEQVPEGNDQETAYTTVALASNEYKELVGNKNAIKNKIEELDTLIEEKFDQLVSGNGDADALSAELYRASDEQMQLNGMLSDISTKARYDETYGTFGLEYDLSNGTLTLHGKKVYHFVDNMADGESGFNGVLWDNSNGEVDIIVVRNESGDIVELKEYNPNNTPKEYRKFFTAQQNSGNDFAISDN